AAQQGDVLGVSNTLADADGLGAITYQWLRAGIDTGTTGTTYTLTQADVGKAISARASYTDGGGTAESVTSAPSNAIVPPPLTVTTLTGTSSGFRVRFNHAIDPGTINLYDAADANYGPADVTLTGAGGAVSGTLILDTDRAGFAFIKTGSVLADGQYTVTL